MLTAHSEFKKLTCVLTYKIWSIDETKYVDIYNPLILSYI
ncbi:hypothetical protein KM759_gp031 [Lymphocystis disease virus 4]|uniref:Uncharacterized protein n=1 Tax=Lymphocystis disease virus 4 TaxID=2704413 RepID=A0A6B9XL93_9VIRU|nr:hypothetical protein KM759_gp031 [Lymphocystis disease virus 4]QHR78579.1 hypothetical protein [Lymphocystis disease virus 4]